MADFLTRLAERTLGVASMVQPVIAPMFAPEPRPANEAPSFRREGDSEVQSLIAPGPSRGVQPLQPGDLSIDTAHLYMPPADAGSSSPPALVPINGYPPPGQGLPGTRYEQAGPAHYEQAPGQLLTAAPGNVRASNTPGMSDQEMTAPDPHVSPELAIRGESSAFRPALLDDDMVAKAGQSMRGVPLDTLLPLQYLEAPAPEKSAPAPTIRVTIGRIEVRAVMPAHEPAARPASTRPKPKLSLDDYLKQQNGG